MKRFWLDALMIGAIALVLLGAVWSAKSEREDSLDEFSKRQTLVAAAIASDFEHRLAAEPKDRIVDELLTDARKLENAGEMMVLVAPPGTPGFTTTDHRMIPSQRLRSALDTGTPNVVVPRDEAVAFGLPRRTAVAGVVRVNDWGIVALSSAERLRDRQIHEQWRLALSVLIVAVVVVGFGTFARRRQRAQLELEREAALAKADKMAAIAALSSGIAHEIGTPLGVMVGRLEQAVERTEDPKTRAALDVAFEQIDRIRGIVRGSLALARGEAPQLVKTEPKRIAERAAGLVRHRFESAGVELAVDTDADLPDIACDPGLFEQAVVNVLLNACEATPRGGAVHLSVTTREGRVEFVVDDDGAGIPDEIAKRATEPFFSTRREKGGSGLGLTIAREIVAHHAGTLTLAKREDGRGTRAAISVNA